MARGSIAIGLLAAACFSLMSLSAKLLSARGVSPLATLVGTTAYTLYTTAVVSVVEDGTWRTWGFTPK